MKLLIIFSFCVFTALGNPTVRGQAIVNSSASPAVISFPSGTAIGDLVSVVANNGNGMLTPAGWSIDYGGTFAHMGIIVIHKTMTSGDISTGSVSISPSGGGLTQGVYSIVSFVGNTQTGLREVDQLFDSTGGSTRTISTSSAVRSSDYAIYVGATQANSTVTVNVGSLVGQVAASNISGALYSGNASAGVNSATFSYATVGTVDFQVIIIVAASGSQIRHQVSVN